jgi:hypothetical protein
MIRLSTVELRSLGNVERQWQGFEGFASDFLGYFGY